jgi:flavin reductase (DIM6/NTAB) family NADH-FMN oxidoreductase RutF
MSLVREFVKVMKRMALGDTLVPQEFTLGMAEPQTEITVWLHGAGAPVDVTHRHSMVCASPLTICVGFDDGKKPSEKELARLSLSFCEREGRKRVLGEIGLKCKSIIPVPGSDLILFEPRSSSNYCLPRAPLWSHYLLYEYRQWRRDNTKGIRMSFLERRAAMVIFICPRPTLLVSVGSKEDGNIFPMNILGYLGNGYLGFALRTERLAGGAVERAGRAALSSLPLSNGSSVYGLAHNHTKESIDWEQLPFATKLSSAFHIPVPTFAQRVREVEIQSVRAIGSHSFFVARVVHDEKFSDGLGFCAIHGFYQSWRLRGLKEQLKESMVEDEHNKRERYIPPPEPDASGKWPHTLTRFTTQCRATVARLLR